MFRELTRTQKIGLQALGIAVILVLIVRFTRFASGSEQVQGIVEHFGYLGILVISIVSGFNVFIPIPAVAFMGVFIDSGLHFWTVIIVISIGMTIGDGVGYLVGRTARDLTHLQKEKTKFLLRLSQLKEKGQIWPYLILLFYVSFAPAPNELIVIPMAFLGYRMKYIFGIILFGNIIFNTLLGLGVIKVLTIF